MRKFILIRSYILGFIVLSLNIQILHAQVERKTRNGVWFLYSKAKTINGLGLIVNLPYPENKEYLNTTVNGINLQVNFSTFFITSLYTVHAIFNRELVFAFTDSNSTQIHLFQAKLVTNGINVKSVSYNPETTNGLSIKFLDIDNINNGLSISVIARREVQRGLAVSLISNIDKEFKGVQIGLINKSRKTKGIQIGLWNVNEKRKLPFFNWNFKKCSMK